MAIVTLFKTTNMNNLSYPGMWLPSVGIPDYLETESSGVEMAITFYGANFDQPNSGAPLTGTITAASFDNDDIGYGLDLLITGLNFTLTVANNYLPAITQPASLLSLFLAGSDTLRGSFGNDVLLGFAGNDTFLFSEGADTYNGGGDADTVSYAGASAGLFAGLEDAGFNTAGAAGDSYISIENLIGTAFNDTLYGTDGVNRLSGANGNDTFVGKGSSDTFDGESGSDTVGYDTSEGVRADLLIPATNSGDASGDVYISIENLAGSSFNDSLFGNGLANVLRGTLYPASASGQDTLDGRGGNDHLFGYDGNDRLIGGPGNDRLFGGLGADRFVFNAALSATANLDTVGDFTVNVDEFELENAIFTGLGAAGALNPNLFFKSASGTAQDANDRIVYNTTTGLLSYDVNGNAAGGVTALAVLSNKAAITAADFTVI